MDSFIRGTEMESFAWNEDLFHTNLELFKHFDALTAYHLEIFNFSRLQHCQTEQNEPNLYQKKYGITHYFHDQKGALAEAQKIADEEILTKTNLIYFYGLGLGYIYDSLKNWLNAATERHLIFLEDDLEVLYQFLHTNRATRLLKDPQVTLFYISELFSEIEQDKLNRLMLEFPYHSIQFLVLPSYIKRNESTALKICYKILSDQSTMRYVHKEYFSGQSGLLGNFYRNLLSLPDAYISNHLYGQFKNIPAIICGAGPSLEKNLDVLKTLSDRALIFAGGSSLNVVNNQGLIPHFGIGIDPNPEQYHRLITNHTFHLPLFYRNRMENRASQIMPGPKIYVPGSDNPLSIWFEKNLGIFEGEVEEGHNVVNFSIEIARRLGCNPIIFVGLDLAFTEVKTYASGIPIHPLWLGENNPYTPEKEQVIARNGIDGQKIMTKWEWLGESDWISNYAKNHPEVKFINATEGGLGFFEISNLPLKEVAEKYLTKSYDLLGRSLGEIQNSASTITRSQVLELINEFRGTLETCLKYCEEIIKIQKESSQQETNTVNESFFKSSKSILYESLLEEEVGYKHFLNQFDKVKFYLQKAQSSRIDSEPEDSNSAIINRYNFVKLVAQQHLELLYGAVYHFIFTSSLPISKDKFFTITNEEDLYQLEGNHLQLKDKELNLTIDLTFKPRQVTETYDNGKLKISCYYDENEQLQGPSRFYSDLSILLAETWFVNGKREGKSRFFYPSGGLYSLLRFKDNTLEGKQEYFFRNSQPSAHFTYANGVLEGPVQIYNTEGKLIREIHYHKGKRHGTERLWGQNGICLLECHYENGIPTGNAYEWTYTGQLSKEVIIHKFPEDFDLSAWDDQHKIVKSFKHGIEDYSAFFEEKQAQVELIEGAIQVILDHLNAMMTINMDPKLADISPEILKELEETQKSLNEMIVLKNQLKSIQEEHMKKTKK